MTTGVIITPLRTEMNMAYRVLIYDRELGRRCFAYGEDRRELRFKTMEEAAAVVGRMVGHGKNWPSLYVIDPAPRGTPDLVPMPDVPKAPRTFRRLATDQPRRFKRLGRG